MGFFCKCGSKFDDKHKHYLRFEEVCYQCAKVGRDEREAIRKYEESLKEKPFFKEDKC